jgi:hypothetical protein
MINVVTMVALAALGAEPSGTSCTVDGAPWEVRPLEAFVATNPATGRRLVLNVYDAEEKQLPYLQVTALWEKLKQSKKLAAKNAAPDAPLEASLSTKPLAPPQPPDFMQDGLHFLEQGTLTLVKVDAKARLLSLRFEGTLREGEPKHPKDHVAKVQCELRAITFKEL